MTKLTNTVTQKAMAKEIVMFSVACVMLIATIIFLALPAVMNGFESNNDAGESEAQLPEVNALIIMLLLAKSVMYGLLLLGGLVLVWIAGLIILGKLISRKKRIPKWLYISSLVLLVLYLAEIAALVTAWIV